jgi:transposase
MINAEQWALVRNLYFVEKMSQRKIYEITGISEKTVRKALRRKEYVFYAGKTWKKRVSKLDPYKSDIAYLLKQYPGLSGKRIFEELVKLGYPGGRTILKDYLQKIRPHRKEVFLRIETLPGEQAQVDWGNCGTIEVDGTKRRLSVFVMVLSYSRLLYLEFTLSQGLDAFLEAHQNAFVFFGGIPRKILYDNLKSVVLARVGRLINFNQIFLAFSGQYLFKPVLCNVGRPNEKGKVESGIKYIRNNFLAGRFFRDYYDLRGQSYQWRDEVANKRVHGTTRQRPIDRFFREKACLQSLPEHRERFFLTRDIKSNSQSLVRFDINHYSVPVKYAISPLTLRANSREVCIFEKDKLVASHHRCFGKHQVIDVPEHFSDLLKHKKKAVAVKLRKEFLSICTTAQAYLEGLAASELNTDHHLKKILELVKLYGKEQLSAVIPFALRYKAFGSEYLKNIILQDRSRRGMKEIINPLVVRKHPELTDLTVEERDLKLYDDLFD